MRKLIALLLIIIYTLAGCGGQGDKDNSSVTQPDGETAAAPESSDETSKPDDDSSDTQSGADESEAPEGKTLVVYYSATGYTKEAAGYIASATGADIFELVPTEPYTAADLDWTNKNSRVSREHDNPDERKVELLESTVDDWDSYDTIFIGYPIWWGIAAWPVDTFIAANDFTGKTVIPFCTSSSSGLGESGKLLAEAAGTGNWLEGQRFRSGVSEKDVQTWIDGLDL